MVLAFLRHGAISGKLGWPDDYLARVFSLRVHHSINAIITIKRYMHLQPALSAPCNIYYNGARLLRTSFIHFGSLSVDPS